MPVDIASGTLELSADDIRIPGAVPLVWDRHYSTAALNRVGAMGNGWTSRYYATLKRTSLGFEYVGSKGILQYVNDPGGLVDAGQRAIDRGSFLEIFREADRYVVRTWDVESGEVQRYCFVPSEEDSPSHLTRIEDATGRGLELAWTIDGHLSAIKQVRERRSLLFNYTPSGRLDAVTLVRAGAGHFVVRYEYDASGRLTAVFDAANNGDRYEYDSDGRIIREVARDGGVFTYHYDRRGRCIKTSGLDRYDEQRLRFLDATRFTEVTNSYDQTFRYQYLPTGQIVRQIDPLGAERTTTYDEHGRVVATKDATDAVTQYTYDDNGNRASVTDPLGSKHTFDYDDERLPVAMTDPLGHLWQRGYDSQKRLVSTTDPLGHQWFIRYDDQGNVTEIENPLGARKRQQYKDGVLAGFTDWLGNLTRIKLDAFGRLIERSGPLGDVTQFTYDPVGNPTRVTFPDSTALHATYDSAGNLTNLTDRSGQVTRFVYGTCHRLLERVSPIGEAVRYVWGSQPKGLDQVINQKGEIYKFFRDEVGRVVREISFDGAERHFTYDAEGHVVANRNANGELITIQRNAAHRVIGQTLPDGDQLSYAFGPTGRLIAATNRDMALRFERDELGRVVREEQGDQWIQNRYDAIGNLIKSVTSLGHVTDYEVDANGFLSGLTTADESRVEFARDAFGCETSRLMPGGVIAEQRHDKMRRLVEQRVSTGLAVVGGPSTASRLLIERDYKYGRTGLLLSSIDKRWGRADYDYDPSERLLRTIRDRGPSEEFIREPGGNITRVKTESQETIERPLVYGPGNRLLRDGGTSFEYDNEGRRVRRIDDADSDHPSVWEYEWDALDRLRAVKRPDGDVWRYKYDALARRVEKAGPGKKRTYVWSRDVVVHESDGERPISTWIFDTVSRAPLATVQSSKLYAVITDQGGSPRELVDNSGTVVWSIGLKAWGGSFKEIHDATNPVDCPVRFQGQWFDEETSLHFNRFRYYDPERSCYISRDPIGLLGGKTNLYAYVSEPNTRVDPLGLMDPWDIQFTQPTISDKFTDGPMAGVTLADAIAQTKAAGQLPPGLELHVMELNGGESLVTLNNRTLYVAQEAGIQVSPTMVGPEGTNKLNKLLDGKAPLDPGEQPEVVCKK